MERERPIQQAETARCRGAFTIIEIIAVLGVLSLLAIVLTPMLLKHMDIGARNSEAAALSRINNALMTHVIRSNSIPSEASWFTALANWLSCSTTSITNNARGITRAFLIDSNGWLGANLPTSGYFSQSAAGTTPPDSARIMVVSSINTSLPVSTGRPSSANFNDIWNTPPNAIPSTWTTWNGRGEDLLIQRINLQPLFSQLILVNRDTNNAAAYTIAGITNLVASSTTSNAFYINGTVIGLGSTNSGNTNLQNSHILNGAISFVFEGAAWGGQIGSKPNVVSTNFLTPLEADFKTAEQAFLLKPDSQNNATTGGAAGDQEQVLAAMSDFMLVYALWSSEGFTQHAMTSGQAKNHLSIYNYLQDSQTWLKNAAGTTRNISSTPFYSGLLY